MLLCDNSTFTFYSEAHQVVSWLDHIVCTATAHNLIDKVWVDYSKVCSDHHPLLASINLSDLVLDSDLHSENPNNVSNIVKWDTLSNADIHCYKQRTEDFPSEVEINHDMILCNNPNCSSQTHKNAIERMYQDITIALHEASQPFTSKNKSNQRV
jgi:hypothetical protein